MKKGEDLLAMYRIANYYYNEKLSQQEIANIMGVSRSQVSRLLILAGERGIVEIKVKLPDTASISELERRLCSLLGLERTLICDSDPPGGESGVDTQLDNLTTFAAAKLPALLGGAQLIGVGRGRTIYNISLRLPVCEATPHRMVVPLTGSTGTRISEMQTTTIVNRFADRLNSEAFYVNCPFLRRRTETSDTEACLVELRDYWSRLDAAVISLGQVSSSILSYITELPVELIKRRELTEAQGEIIGQLFSEKGPLNWYERNAAEYQYIGIPLERLAQVKNTICIARGTGKVQPLMTAARLGYYKTLVTDKNTARELIAKLR